MGKKTILKKKSWGEKKNMFQKKSGKDWKEKNIMFIKKKLGWKKKDGEKKKHCGQKSWAELKKKKKIVQIKNTDKDNINI